MTIISSTDAPTFDVGGTHVVGLASPSRGAAQTSAWRLTLDPGSSSPRHSLSHEEIFVALHGRVRAEFDDGAEEIPAGGALIIPAGVEFTLVNPGDEPFQAVVAVPVGVQATVAGERVDPPWAV
jgi:quercetin dioxygenase-like cupin family protein